ncbi:MAG: hypothetical protein SF069_01780 [Phycisphaerae bacterium]|nr:hypothetical protein [Phycisphaerae bacterium]
MKKTVELRYRTLRVAVLLALFAGCVTPPPNGNDNGNGNSANGNANTTPPPTLSDAQKAAINEANRLFGEAAQTLSAALSGPVNPSFDPENPSLIGGFGTCPTVSFVSSADVIAMAIEYPTAGCNSQDAGDVTVSGLVGLTINRGTRAGTITFTNFVVDGVAISGNMTLTVTGNATTGVQFQGNLNLTIGGITVTGVTTFVIADSGAITFNSDGMTVSDSDSNFVLTLDDVVVNAIANNNFVPQAGVMTFNFESNSISITFDANSPSTRQVQVRVNGSSPATYTLP